jgi:hypothetical protein
MRDLSGPDPDDEPGRSPRPWRRRRRKHNRGRGNDDGTTGVREPRRPLPGSEPDATDIDREDGGTEPE